MGAGLAGTTPNNPTRARGEHLFFKSVTVLYQVLQQTWEVVRQKRHS
jgi:hypothetical protein